MTLTPTLIVFDCDGTLADSQHLMVEAIRLAFEAAGFSAPERSAILRTIGFSLPDALRALVPGQSQETRTELARSYREKWLALRRQPDAGDPLFPGAASFLFGLAAREDAVLGIATGKSRRAVMRLIEANGLQNVFSTIQTADDAPPKPSPAMLLQAMEETGAAPEKTVMIGDTCYDMIMAASANAASIGVSWGYHSAQELKSAGAKTVVRSFHALQHALRPGLPAFNRYEESAVFMAAE